jgi:hypothetical protein
MYTVISLSESFRELLLATILDIFDMLAILATVPDTDQLRYRLCPLVGKSRGMRPGR